MRTKFLELQQGDQTVDAYITEFVKLSRFAPALVVDEVKWAHMFQ